MQQIEFHELNAAGTPYLKAAVPSHAFVAGWRSAGAVAVLVAGDEGRELLIEGELDRLTYVRVLAAASEHGSVDSATVPRTLGSQLRLEKSSEWAWMWRDEPLRSLPMGCEIVTDGHANGEISHFLQQASPRASAMPGDPEIAFWVVHRDGEGALNAVAAGSEWQSGAKVIVSVAVREDSRRQGLGRIVTQVACSEWFGRGADFVALGVRSSNAGAVALYQQLGFDSMREWTSFGLRSD